MPAPPLKTVTPLEIKAIKRRAKQLNKQLTKEGTAKSYMQCLDIVCQEEMGLRHFHEAQKLASQRGTDTRSGTRSGTQSSAQSSESPWTLYLQACQESYFEI